MKQPDTGVKPWYLQERLVFGLVAIFSLTGIFSWFSVNEQEDPFFPYRNGFVSVSAPGWSAQAIEDSLVRTLERRLAEVDEIVSVSASTTDGAATVDIELNELISHTDIAWQRVRDKVSSLQAQYSGRDITITLEERAQDTAGIVFAVQTSRSLLEARQFALKARDKLYKLAAIRKVALVGDPQQQIRILYPQSSMLSTGISPLAVAEQVQDSNNMTAVGAITGSDFQTAINPLNRLDTLQALQDVMLSLPSEEIVRLAQLSQIEQTIAPIATESFWWEQKRAVGLAITVPPNQLRVTEFGEALLHVADELNKANPDFQLIPVIFQPWWTEVRRDSLVVSLLLGCAGVGLVLFGLMSRGIALMVMVTVPAISLTALAFFGMGGGVLQQMSIAGLVISLGLIVDNSIVISELIARYRAEGATPLQAASQAIRDLYRPLATSTFTTVAAFIPMVLAQGNVADFVRTIPAIVILSIATSCIYALFLVPVISQHMASLHTHNTARLLQKWGVRVGTIGTRHPVFVAGLFLFLVLICVGLSGQTVGEFFPKSDRNQVIVDIQSDYGTRHDASVELARQVEKVINAQPNVEQIVTFVGNSGPRFYYNLAESMQAPHIARVVFSVEHSGQIPALVASLNSEFATRFASARVRARQIGQGPPLEAPVEISVLGENRAQLYAAAEHVFAIVAKHAGTTDVRRDYVHGKPAIEFELNDDAIQKAGLSKTQLSQFLAWRSNGLNVTTLATERENVPVVLVDNRRAEKANVQYLMDTTLINDEGLALPMSLFMRARVSHAMPVLTRRDGFNALIVKAELSGRVDSDTLISDLLPELKKVEQQFGVELVLGGEWQEEEESGSAMLRVVPIGALLLFGALILQFNSFRLAGLIMLSIPLAMIGVFPALALAGVKFGFMSVLGLLALTGVVVNTAIILIERVMSKLKEQEMSLQTAIEQAVSERFRPVLLTAVTTIIGLVPLTLPVSPLWPPLAWTMIGGLITSTLLTMLVLPALLKWLLSKKTNRLWEAIF